MKSFLKKLFSSQALIYKALQQVYHYRYWHPKACNEDIIQKYNKYNVNFSITTQPLKGNTASIPMVL